MIHLQESEMTNAETQELDRAVDAEDVREAIKKLAKNCSKLKNFCTSNRVDAALPRVLVEQKASWLDKVEEMYLLLLDEAEDFNMDDDSKLSAAQRDKVKHLKEDIVRYVSAFKYAYTR